MRLTDEDWEALAKAYITRDLGEAAGLYRVLSIEGRDLVGRTGVGDFSGIAIPWTWPGTTQVIGVRLRLDHPPIDVRTGKPLHKYLVAPGQRNHIYMPLAEPAWLTDVTMPAIITEGEKKGLALFRAAFELAAKLNGASGKPLFLAMALAGAWGWRGKTGIATDAQGLRVPEKGVIPDFDRVAWEGRKVILLYDTDVRTNPSVSAARWGLACELEHRGAQVFLIDLPPEQGVNGIDDYLGLAGLDPFLELYRQATRADWHDELVKSDKGKILPTFSNALTALRLAPAWHGVLVFNEFALRTEMRQLPPWGGEPGPWGDLEDSLLIAWMESQGIRISDTHATRAALTVAREDPYHPVRDYLEALKWDGIQRIDDWLTLYLGVEPNDYTRAVGACWLISAVARIYQPGVKADCALTLEGPQGAGKSTALEILGGEFYSDDIADLGTKDAALGTGGVWIVELAELAAMGRAEAEKVKSFISRRTDRFRPPYGRHYIWVSRQCVFGGSINQNKYLKDETGGRRFWPVHCGNHLRLESLRRDRNQLWAEAVVRYRQGDHWWLEKVELTVTATEEQEKRYVADPWEIPVAKWLELEIENAALRGVTAEVTTADVLTHAIKKDMGQWSRADECRVGILLHRLGWEVFARRRSKNPSAEEGTEQAKDTRPRVYRKKDDRENHP